MANREVVVLSAVRSAIGGLVVRWPAWSPMNWLAS